MTVKIAKKTKTAKLTAWDLALLEKALRSYGTPGFHENGKASQEALIEKVTHALSGRLYFA